MRGERPVECAAEQPLQQAGAGSFCKAGLINKQSGQEVGRKEMKEASVERE